MSKPANQAELISLPKGGGATKGLGEKFAPDLHTGTGNFTVPIALPPGRNGFQPKCTRQKGSQEEAGLPDAPRAPGLNRFTG